MTKTDMTQREAKRPPTFTTYVTPGPEIFSLECSHPLEGLFTSPPPPPGFQSSPPGWSSSSLLFLLMLMAGSSCEQGVEWEAKLHREPPTPEAAAAAAVAALGLGLLELPEPDPPPPCSFDTARSLTAEGRPLMPSKLPELLNFRLDTLLMRVQRVVPPSSRWSEPWLVGVLEPVVEEDDWTSVGGVYDVSAADWGEAETLGFMDRPWRSSSTDVTDSFLKRLYLVRWSIPFSLLLSSLSPPSDTHSLPLSQVCWQMWPSRTDLPLL